MEEEGGTLQMSSVPASSGSSQPKDDDDDARCERLLIQWLFSQMVLRTLLATVCHRWLSVLSLASAASVLWNFNHVVSQCSC